RVTGIAYRSGSVRPGDAFFCIPGTVRDGHDFARDAVARGAAVLVVSRELPDAGAPQVVVGDPRAALAIASARFFGMPSERLRVVGITGTNGKTTTAYLVEAILKEAGLRTGLIGTVETRMEESAERSVRTTPESRDLQELLSRMADSGVEAVVMEVSSHAVELRRVDAVRFAVAAFTNLSQDHLDFHHTMEDYFSAKARLFAGIAPGAQVVNVDDWYGRRIAAETGATWTVGRTPEAVLSAREVRLAPSSSSFRLVGPSLEADITLPLAGDFNVSNALVAAGCALALGLPLDAVVAGLAAAPQVPGRLERVDEGQPFSVLVDYAHTPDGLAKALEAVREVTSGRVITVFGCGGDRDPVKRPLMGAAAGRLSDVAVLTSDNPRSEDPAAIIRQVEGGLDGTTAEKHVVADRREAIRFAVSAACPGDTVLVAGKGHEDYQVFADRKVRFDDREVAREELRALDGAWRRTC
ncbi:MAG TPA: UDP-N-acetylmuramoyl-L-alanyl-D-glutamate--2,6-diaminopimelate ligase, partial [Coriobacteriia bacterium]